MTIRELIESAESAQDNISYLAGELGDAVGSIELEIAGSPDNIITTCQTIIGTLESLIVTISECVDELEDLASDAYDMTEDVS